MNQRYLLFLLFVFPALSSAINGWAAHLHPESWYQEQWCTAHNGRIEVVLDDGTRCDCLTETHAIEFDFGSKWYEAVGQSLYYGLQTGKQPGIVLILETESERKYWLRLNSTILHYDLPIDTWETNEDLLTSNGGDDDNTSEQGGGRIFTPWFHLLFK